MKSSAVGAQGVREGGREGREGEVMRLEILIDGREKREGRKGGMDERTWVVPKSRLLTLRRKSGSVYHSGVNSFTSLRSLVFMRQARGMEEKSRSATSKPWPCRKGREGGRAGGREGRRQ